MTLFERLAGGGIALAATIAFVIPIALFLAHAFKL